MVFCCVWVFVCGSVCVRRERGAAGFRLIVREVVRWPLFYDTKRVEIAKKTKRKVEKGRQR